VGVFSAAFHLAFSSSVRFAGCDDSWSLRLLAPVKSSLNFYLCLMNGEYWSSAPCEVGFY
jgi:hypothetical protein